ncbi:GerMN domain-containing protein [Halalkalibacter oceani]|uniref:GerMN domain-containing protein n=1 Tax=Halalkalibacter oceani TaxID=1653776 RepID=A0A9X2IR21_9BACI|nr:GerMN domain-containing protein [Halalkalibacter oceani]MCM3715163.1 GerMN domain-containing protein [Halalkalibacter oceani]
MKKQWMVLFASFLLLALAACGQGTTSPEEPEPAPDNIELEENEDLSGEETPADEEEPVTDETPDQSETPDGEAQDNSVPVELVFSDDQVMDMFRVERQIEAAEDEVFVATLQEWVAGPTEDEEGLVSLIPDNVEVQSVEEVEGVAHVSFSAELLDAQAGSGTEEMILQQVAMIMKQFGFNETQILIDGESHPELFGHVDTSVPIVADSLEDYEKVE